MKYITAHDPHTKTPLFIVFSEEMTHSHVAAKLFSPHVKITGAGFVRRGEVGWGIYGESETLGNGPHPNDIALLTMALDEGLTGSELAQRLLPLNPIPIPPPKETPMDHINPNHHTAAQWQRYWGAHVTKNPQFANEELKIEITVKMLRRFMEEAFNRGIDCERSNIPTITPKKKATVPPEPTPHPWAENHGEDVDDEEELEDNDDDDLTDDDFGRNV